jgi:hypothetical protein
MRSLEGASILQFTEGVFGSVPIYYTQITINHTSIIRSTFPDICIDVYDTRRSGLNNAGPAR